MSPPPPALSPVDDERILGLEHDTVPVRPSVQRGSRGVRQQQKGDLFFSHSSACHSLTRPSTDPIRAPLLLAMMMMMLIQIRARKNRSASCPTFELFGGTFSVGLCMRERGSRCRSLHAVIFFPTPSARLNDAWRAPKPQTRAAPPRAFFTERTVN